MQDGNETVSGHDERRPSHARSAITPRAYYRKGKVETPRHWVRGDPFATAFFNSLSVVFPEGERMMIHAMAKYAGKLTPDLNADLKKFIEQEASHSREHDDMNAALERAGYDISELERVIKSLVKFFDSKSDLMKLTATTCIEHITAIIAAEILEDDSYLEGADPEQLPIWIWHALEEVEHKSVAFDCWDYVTRDMPAFKKWAFRCGVMVPLSLSFFINRTRGQVTLLRQDGYGRLGALRGVLRNGFSKGGLGRNIIRPWARFLKPGFHPNDVDESALLQKAEELFAQMQAEKNAIESQNGDRRKALRLPKAA